MSLTRVWTPSGNYSGGGSKRILVIHTMEGFTGPYGAKDCAIYFQSDCGASSQVCIDNNRGMIWEGVSRSYGAWTQCGFNSESISCEQSGYASWSRDYWLNNRSNQLHNIADWLAEESAITGIPLIDISASAAQGSGRGVCYHSELGSSGCGHSDPGSGFPLDKVLEWAMGGAEAAPEEEIDVTPAAVFWTNPDTGEETLHEAMRWSDGRVCYRGLGTSGGFWSVDENSRSKSGVGIAVSKSGKLVITYVNMAGDVCHYEKAPGASSWSWVKIGGDA